MSRDFIGGIIAMGFLVAAGFFLRFWQESHDRLFAFFAVAFLLMALNRWLLGGGEDTLLPYLIRLASYAIIMIAIVDKNLRRA
jgi:hypothetical protein